MSNLSDYFPALHATDVYTPATQYFDGSDWWYDSYTAVGNKITVVGRFKMSTWTGGTTRTIFRATDTANTESRGAVYSYAGDHGTTTRRNCLRFISQNTAGTLVCDLWTEPLTYMDDEWHYFLVAFDGDIGEGVFLIDGVDVIDATNAEHVAPTTGTLNTGTERIVVANASTGSFFFYVGHLGAIGMVDLYLPNNWTYFMESGGTPKKIDEVSWEGFGGVQPIIWHEAGHMRSNKGTSGLGTQTGTPSLNDELVILAGVPDYTPDFLVIDRFQGPNEPLEDHVPDVNYFGHPWVSQDFDSPYDGSAWAILNQEVGLTGASEICNGVIECRRSDVIIEDTIIFNGTAGSGSQGVIFRYVDRDNYWLLGKGANTTTLYLSELVAGSLTDRDTGAVTLSAGSRYQFKVVLSGDDITGYVDGVEIVSYNSSIHNSATKHGIEGISFTSGGSTEHRNFWIRDNS